MRSFKDKNIQNKQVDYNSDRLSNLTNKTFLSMQAFGREATIFLIHELLNFQNIELRKSLLSNINNDGDNNEKKNK